MKPFSQYLLLIVLFTTIGNVIFAQSNSINNSVNASSSDTLWQATLTYDFHTKVLCLPCNTYDVKKVIISNFNIQTHKGSIQSLINTLKSEVISGKHQLYELNKYEDLAPLGKLSFTKKDSLLYKESSKWTYQDSLDIPFKKIIFNSITLSEEWLYNAASNKILVNIHDASIGTNMDMPNYHLDRVDLLGYNFGTWSNDSIDFNQKLFKPEIVWAKIFTTPDLWVGDSIRKKNEIDTINASLLKSMSVLKDSYGFINNIEDWLFDAVKEHKLTPYQYITNSDRTGAKLTGKKLDTLLTKAVCVGDGGPMTCGRVQLDYFDIIGMKIVQEISFNDKTFRFESKITRVLLLRKFFDIYGNEFPNEAPVPVFWIKFE